MSNDGSYGQNPNPQGWNEWNGQPPQSQPSAGWDNGAGWQQTGSQPSANQYPGSTGSAGWAGQTAGQTGPQPGQYPDQSGYAQPQPTPGYQPQPGYPPTTGYQPSTGYQPPAEPPKKKSNLTALIAGGVGLALIAAIATGVLLSRNNNTAGGDPSETPTQTPTPTVKAPGPGNYDALMEYLKDEDFTCTDEDAEGIKSSICTHFDTAPFMIAYVGATETGGLGRVSLEVQEDARASTSKAISDHLIKQFATTEQASDITTKIATAAAPGYTKDDRSGDVRYRGNARGSVVLWIEDWVPEDLQPTVVSVTDAQIDKIVTDNGYKCEANGTLQSCTKTADDITYQLVYQKAEGQDGLSRLSVRAYSATAGIARPAFQTEAKKIFGELPDGQGDPVTTWMAKQDEKAGGMEFVDGKIVDYYPRSTVSGNEAGSIYIWVSCWTGTRDQC
ncbi:hypothetical protein ACPCG0_10910 [Propionibacteriaceae bacterium Y1923]|uniref:hypothetical protein n=1 Tax=Aestuariimicrobium sp. Y1814 TaxID=3418742 RepID=UPI003C1C50A0